MKYEYTIYTRDINSRDSSWDCMLSGFSSSHEALSWLMSTYEYTANFWVEIEVKVIREEVEN